MTGNFEQPKHTGASAAWPEASCVSLRSQGLAQPGTNLVQAEDILTPEELAAYSVFSALTKRFAQPGLKVPDSWVNEKTRGRCRTFSVSLRLLRCSLPLRFAQPGRNRADSMPASRELRAIQFGCPPGSPTLATWLTAPAPRTQVQQDRIFPSAGNRPATDRTRSQDDKMPKPA